MSAITALVPVGNYGCNTYRNISLLKTGVAIETTETNLYGWVLANNASSARFVKLYNQVAAPASTDTPVETIEIPASTTLTYSIPVGIHFSLGLGIRACTGVADNDNTDPSANDVVVVVFSKSITT